MCVCVCVCVVGYVSYFKCVFLHICYIPNLLGIYMSYYVSHFIFSEIRVYFLFILDVSECVFYF